MDILRIRNNGRVIDLGADIYSFSDNKVECLDSTGKVYRVYFGISITNAEALEIENIPEDFQIGKSTLVDGVWGKIE